MNVLEESYFNYVYHYTDHLGNIRVSYGIDPESFDLVILEENHYYPFGMKHANYNVGMRTYIRNNMGQIELPLVSDVNYKYKYNGKEFQDELGLNMYDYGARNYDAALGRWMNMDPLTVNSRRWTPYNYAYNNPMYFIDPDGMQAFGYLSNLGADIAGVKTAYFGDLNNKSNNDELKIKGVDADEAISKLNQDSQLNLVRDSTTGLVTMSDRSKIDYDNLTCEDQALFNIIEDGNNTVNITTTQDIVREDADGNLSIFLFGKYNGQTLNNSFQEVNVLQAIGLENGGGQTAGTTIRHEIFEGASALGIVKFLYNIHTGMSTGFVPPAFLNNVYFRAHLQAVGMDSNFKLNNITSNQFHLQTNPNYVLWMNLNPNANSNTSQGWFKLQ